MKRRFWIGGVLLLMFFTGMTGCGGPKEPPPEHMLDGPDMMYTPASMSSNMARITLPLPWRGSLRTIAPSDAAISAVRSVELLS